MSQSKEAVVVDNGTYLIKAGLAGTPLPKCLFRNITGTPKHLRVMDRGLERSFFVGPDAEQHRGALTMRYPMDNGVIVDWSGMEKVWDYMYDDQQLGLNRVEHPVLFTEKPFETHNHRTKLAEIFFEAYGVPGLHFEKQAILSLYATGRTTGLICDSGEGVTQVVPVYQGFELFHGSQQTDVAGKQVSDFLKKLLWEESDHRETNTTNPEIIRGIKESCCALRNLGEIASDDVVNYILPDGSSIKVGSARFDAPEVMFRPNLIGEELPGIHELISKSVTRVDVNLRRALFQNIIISGGNTLMAGFCSRLLSELKRVAPKLLKIRMAIPNKRSFSPWIGGSILASQDAFFDRMVKRKDYIETGPNIFLPTTKND